MSLVAGCLLLLCTMGPAIGGGTNPDSVVKVLTFNLHGWEVEWPTRLRMIVDAIEDLQPDLIGLQEVLQTPGTGGADNSARVIADSLFRRTGIRYEYLFERTHTGWGLYDEGLGILTRHIILEQGVRNLPVGVFQRKALYCRVMTPLGIVNFFDVHLSHLAQDEPVRVAQVSEIRTYVEEKSSDGVAMANIVCGDFNAVPGSPPIVNMTGVDAGGIRYLDSWAVANPGQSGYTVPAEGPNARIDYIFLRDGNESRIVASRRVLNEPGPGGVYPSDHIGVFSTFETTLNPLEISLLLPSPGDRISGQVEIAWSIEDQPDSLSISVFYSDDAGRTWTQLWSGSGEENSHPWNTLSVSDGTRYLLRVVAMGRGSFGMTESPAPFTVNNPGNAPPEIELNDPRGGELLHDEYEIKWTADDADGDLLRMSIDISLDDGVTWHAVVSDEPDNGSFFWETRGMANSPFYRMRLRCTDGLVEAAVLSETFTIYNERQGLADSLFCHTAGYGNGTIGGTVIESGQLTGHVYRITFDDTLTASTTYDVFDLDAGLFVVRAAGELDGFTEGPLFDGLRLVVSDYPQAAVDLAGTGWESGGTNMTHTISLPELDFGTETIRGTPYPADYLLTVSGQIVDTSSSYLGAMPVPLTFSVWNTTEDHKVEVIFIETDQNGELSPHDEIYILEENDQGEPFLTWLIFFSGTPSSTPPLPGDRFVLATLKPFTHRDVFEFSTSPRLAAGDVNGDDAVDVLDVVVIVRHILALEHLTGSPLRRADCTGEGDVDVLDVLCVVNMILGMT